MEINNRPNPNEAFPNPKIPSLCFIKNVVEKPHAFDPRGHAVLTL